MNRPRVSEATRITPAVPHQWLGETTPLRMVIDADVVLTAPLELSIAGDGPTRTAAGSSSNGGGTRDPG
jgi:hypothetical protein